MASSLPSNCYAVIKQYHKRSSTTHQALQVRAQISSDEGRSSDIVDTNLNVLRERIQEVKIKERLERCCRCEYGWNYSREYNYKPKLDLMQFFELVGLVCGTVGFTCLTGTILLCLVSLLLQWSK